MTRQNIVLPRQGTASFDRTGGGGLVNRYSYNFNGSNQYIDIGVLPIYEFDGLNDPFSCGGWFKTSSGTQQVIMGKQGGLNNAGWRITQNSGSLRFHISGGSGSNRIEVRMETGTMNDAAWHHVTWMYDGSGVAAGVSCVVDGVDRTGVLVVSSDNIVSTIDSGVSMQLAGRNGTNNTWNGNLDWLGIWNSELSVAQAQAVYNSGVPTNLNALPTSSTLIGFWPMGDTTDINDFPNVNDLSTQGNDGTATNMLISAINVDIP